MTEREAIDEVKKHLTDYLDSAGIDYSGSAFKCPMPTCIHANGDKRASAQLGTEKETVYCHTSLSTWNIFNFAEAIEGLPNTKDERFYLETLPTLAERYGIEYEKEVMTDETKIRLDYYRIYEDAELFINSHMHVIEPYLSSRKWNSDTIHRAFRMGLGSIENKTEYYAHLKSKGWTWNDIEEAKLSQENLFVPESVIIPIADEKDRTIAFVARHVGTSFEKYVNTSETPYYKKGKVLFNFYDAKQELGPLWIVEGYLDVVSMSAWGIKKVVALGGIALTQDHINLLEANRCTEIILCLDGDDRGQKATRRAIEILSKHPKLKVRIMELPDGMDPDDIIIEKGIDSLKGILTRTIFEYRLHRDFVNATVEDIQKEVIPIVSAEESPILRDSMLKAISDLHMIELSVLKKELDHQLERKNEKDKYKETQLINQALSAIQNPMTDTVMVLEELSTTIKAMRSNRKMIDPEEMKIDILLSLEKEWRENKPGIAGYKIPSFPKFSNIFDGFPRGACMITVGALASHGKSTLVRNAFWDIAINNDDVQCLYMSIDDNARAVNKSLIIMNSALEVGEVRKYTALTPDKQERWEAAFKKVKDQDNFTVIDSTVGRSVYSLTQYIDKYMEKYPLRKPIVAIDNFHILDGINDQEIRQRTMENAKTLKYISTSYDIPILVVVQLNKTLNGYRPVPRDIQESVQIEYESDVLMLLHSDLQMTAESYLNWRYINRNNEDIKMPYMEAFVWKNKYEEFKSTGMEDTIWCKLNRSTSKLEEVEYADIPRKRKKAEDEF